MSESSSNDINDGGHHGTSSGRHNGVNGHGRPSKMDNTIDAMIAEEEDMQRDVVSVEEEHIQLDYLLDEPEEEGEDQAIPSDVNTDEESVDDENWQAGCDPSPSAKGEQKG